METAEKASRVSGLVDDIITGSTPGPGLMAKIGYGISSIVKFLFNFVRGFARVVMIIVELLVSVLGICFQYVMVLEEYMFDASFKGFILLFQH
jgi:hypothetical protein